MKKLRCPDSTREPGAPVLGRTRATRPPAHSPFDVSLRSRRERAAEVLSRAWSTRTSHRVLTAKPATIGGIGDNDPGILSAEFGCRFHF